MFLLFLLRVMLCAQGVPSFNEPMAALGKRFLRAFERATPDFQAKVGYEVDAPGQADMTIASNAVCWAAVNARVLGI